MDFDSFTFTFAMIKSFIFPFIIVSISGHEGYRIVSGGALEVGKASTSAVTKSCIIVLLFDFILAKLLLT